MSTSTRNNENGDVTFNRSLLIYGDSMRNAQSWLVKSLKNIHGTTPAETGQEDEADIEGDEEEGGLGYVTPKTSLNQDRQSLSANDKLRQQLLGKSARQITLQGKSTMPKVEGLAASKPRPKTQTKASNQKESDDEDEGRTSAVKNRINQSHSAAGSVSLEETNDSPKSITKKRPNSYLDEVLAQRQKKRSKNQKNENYA